MLREFKAFIVKENVLALAIAVVLGAAFGKVVTAVVDDFVMPIVGALTRRELAEGDLRHRIGEVRNRRFRLGADQLHHHRVCRLADQQDVHTSARSGDRSGDETLSLLQDGSRSRGNAVPALHQRSLREAVTAAL